jgi:hypothetical protein
MVRLVQMKPITARALNSLIWIICGILVITIRTVIIPTASILIWELLGGAMITYGAAKLAWFLTRKTQAEPAKPAPALS